MGEIGRWNRHRFIVSSEVIRSFDNLNITGSSETEEKEAGQEKYVSYKSAKPTQITLDVRLSAQLGCDVREEAMGMVADSSQGISDYFYIGKEKLVSYKLMLTDASVSDVGITYNGDWSQATVRLTFRQSTKLDGTVNGNGSGGGGGNGGGNGDAVKQAIKDEKKIHSKDNVKPKTDGTESGGSQPIDVWPVIQTVMTNTYGSEAEKNAQQARQTAANIISMAKATSARSNSTDIKRFINSTKINTVK